MAQLSPHCLTAINIAKDSENRMHDDTVARQFGFTGGLVPGIAVFAYMSHMPVEKWGRAFLERGIIETKFHEPIYDGDPVVVTAEEADAGIAIKVESRGIVCAAGTASLPAESMRIVLSDFEDVPPANSRRPVSTSSYVVDSWLGTVPLTLSEEGALRFLAGVCETSAIYAAENLAHPGHLLRTMNSVLMDNALLGPWIHVSSRCQFFHAGAATDAYAARARVTGNFDRKGHKFVELDGVVVANNAIPVARCRHVAIYQPRGVAPT